MIFVSEKMIVKHTLDAEEAFVEIPLRITFEYALQDQRFMPGTMQRKVLYNLEPVLRRFNTVLREVLEAEIETTVDQALTEHLVYANQASANVALYRDDADGPLGPDSSGQQPDAAGTYLEGETPRIILPR